MAEIKEKIVNVNVERIKEVAKIVKKKKYVDKIVEKEVFKNRPREVIVKHQSAVMVEKLVSVPRRIERADKVVELVEIVQEKIIEKPCSIKVVEVPREIEKPVFVDRVKQVKQTIEVANITEKKIDVTKVKEVEKIQTVEIEIVKLVREPKIVNVPQITEVLVEKVTTEKVDVEREVQRPVYKTETKEVEKEV